MKNYIQLSEVYIKEVKKEMSDDVFIKPSDIVCIKRVTSDKHPIVKSAVHVKNFNNICQGFNFDGPILCKETVEQIDEKISKFYEKGNK